MADQETETQEISFAQGIMQSIRRIVIGLILFLASFVVLWWNEGRADISEIARKSIPISADTIDTSYDGEPVSVTGEIESNKSLGDPGYFDFGPYIRLNRKAEMYAWVEEKSSTARKLLGRRKAREPTYSYKREWTEKPLSSDSFSEPTGHKNPTPSVKSRSYTVKHATVGAYRLDPQSATLPDPLPVPITIKNYIPSLKAWLQDGYIFIGKGSAKNPEVGDIRISYTAVGSGTVVTMFGRLAGESIEPHIYGKRERLYQVVAGSREDAIAQMATEHKVIGWALRLAGFLMMWTALCLFFGPITAVLDFVPALGNIGRSAVAAAMFAAALILSLLTILVSMIPHGPLLLLFVAVVAAGAAWAVIQMRRKPRKKTAPKVKRKRDTLPLQDMHVRKKTTSDEREPARPPIPQKTARPKEIKFACEKCGMRYTVPVALAGRKARCKGCQHKFYIPPVSVRAESDSTVFDSSPQ